MYDEGKLDKIHKGIIDVLEANKAQFADIHTALLAVMTGNILVSFKTKDLDAVRELMDMSKSKVLDDVVKEGFE